jgi:hypothetical protein
MKDSHGLFDYETSQITHKSLIVTNEARLIRENQDVTAADKNMQINNEYKVTRGLLNIGKLKDCYWVYTNSLPDDEDLWIVLRDYKENGHPGYKLKEGLTIKMGRCRYVLTELVLNEEVDKSFDNTYMEPVDNNASISWIEKFSKLKLDSIGQNMVKSEGVNSEKKIEEKACRICLTDENTPENLLIESPCSCTGSVRFIHVTCLKYWLKSKVSEIKKSYSATYAWKVFECELCKMKYPGKLIS